MSDLIYMGGNVKALGDGRVEGYLIQYSTANAPDLSAEKDFFTAETDYDLETGNRKSVFYAHGLDTKMSVKRIGVSELKQDEVGVWIASQLNMRDEYERAIYKMAEQGKLGWSSGAPSHLVTRKAVTTDAGTVHEILTWPIAEASLTPCPADHRNQAMALKSVAGLIADDGAKEPGIGDDNTKALPDGWSYRDLMNFLESEANEDFGSQGSTDVYGMYTPSVMVSGCNLLENPDRFVYRRTDEPGDLFARPYTIENNDAVWGDEQEVIETTTYVNASDDDAAPMMAGKQADVTALKAMLRDSMTLDDHADVVQDAMSGFVTRAESLSALAAKAGKPMSAARHAKLSQAYAGMRTAHTAMETHLAAINDMLLSTNPDAKKEADEVGVLRMRHERIKARHLNIAV